MILIVDETSEVPIYQQLRDQIVVAIADGSLDGGDPLPSTRQLAADLGVNFHTVHKAYDLLRREGFVVLTRRAGALIRPRPDPGSPPPGFVPQWERTARTLLAEAAAQGVPAAQILDRCSAILASFTLETGARP
ncbi:MAG TPA: GntR family transcriptional regulator [Catenuloplanes sp.]|jgi:DNA-binding transcriptional regulator YhcF (GntR family)